MFSFLLVTGIAYGIAYWICSTGLAYWRAFVGFILGFSTGWFGGSVISVFLLSQFISMDSSATEKSVFLKSAAWALLGAGYGVYRARVKLRTGYPAPPIVVPKWALKIVGLMAVIGIAAAVAIPAYQSYTKSQALPIAFGENDKIVHLPDVSPPISISSQTFGENDRMISPPANPQKSQIDTFLNSTPEKPLSDDDKNEVALALINRREYASALKILSPLAIQGNASAQGNLGAMYNHGQGVTQDFFEAVRWYRLGAEQGNSNAQSNLGAMYGTGQGTTKDYVRAHMWFNLAAISGNQDAVKGRDISAKLLTPEGVAQAQQMARECQQRNFKGC